MPIEDTFANELMGIPLNGKKVVVWMANIWRFDEGKVMEWWFNTDTYGAYVETRRRSPDEARWTVVSRNLTFTASRIVCYTPLQLCI